MSNQIRTEGENPPVTFSAVWTIRPGKARELELALQNLMQAASKFQGHLGGTVLHPGESPAVYKSIIAFDSRTHFEAWDASEECKAQVKQAEAFSREPAKIRFLDGLGVWFPSSNAAAAPPAAWKTILLTTMALYPVVRALMLLFSLAPMKNLPPGISLLFTLLLACVILTYAAMPLVTRIFHRWLVPGA